MSVTEAGSAQLCVRVLVADDHAVVREGLASAMRDRRELELVAEVDTGEDALEAIRQERPDVAVVDVQMPRLDGLDVVATAKREGLPTRVLLLSAFTDGQQVYGAIAAGAAGYLSKRQSRRVICDAVLAVARGDRVFSSDAQTELADHVQREAQAARRLLSDRELDVLRLCAQGHPISEIAQRLHVSVSTVKNHQQHLYDKLGVSNAAAAVYDAMRRRLLE